MAKVCASCGAPLEDSELFCTACGTPVDQKKEESKIFCPQCGNVLSPDAIFCDVCGRETERAKTKKKKAEDTLDEPAVMEGLVAPTITEDMFAGDKAKMNQKFDGFESVDESAIKKAQESKELRPKAMPSFEMDSAALPERKKEEKAPPKPAPAQKKEVTAESIKNANPYGDFAAKSGGKTIQTAKDSSEHAKAEPSPAQTEAPAKQPGGFAGFIQKIKSIFTKK